MEGIEVSVVNPTSARHRILTLSRETDGFHTVTDREGRAGDRYQFRVGNLLLPDPASRAQAGSVHEASMVVDPSTFAWTDDRWQRPEFRDVAIYELHVGTFTPEGTFRAAMEKLPYLRELGVTAIELMPIADFPGSRSWGYDGVLIYAPARAYGSPDDLRAFVDAAHAHGLAVILDVVYNHFGPDGNYLSSYSPHFSTNRHKTPWGAGFNVDGEMSGPVREFFVGNPAYWMEDFHIDGFRLDATHEIADESPKHILAEIVEVIHARGGYAIAEDCRNERRLLMEPRDGGIGFDAVWADDFHHIARIMQTGESEAYFSHFRGTCAELIDTLQHGWHYRGQASIATGKARGSACIDLPPSKFLHCISNHDQVGNRAFGKRLSDEISPEAYRALSMLLCLTPYTPMFFMGQEWAASTPFLYFTDHTPELGVKITEGRRREFAGFAAFRDCASISNIPDPQVEETFRESKLNWSEPSSAAKAPTLALHRECLRLRREMSAFRPNQRETWDARALGPDFGALRFADGGGEYLLLFTFGSGGTVDFGKDPFAAPPAGRCWKTVLSSNEARFGGSDDSISSNGEQFTFPSAGAVLFQSATREK
jgi:maltooligosyltrehalose trehalohydrolase